MEIQPAAQRQQQEETVLVIHQDDGEPADDRPAGDGNGGGDSARQRAAPMQRVLVETIDGDRVPAHVAQALCRKSEQQLHLYHGGFALLPLLWLVNVWLFWPDFRHGHDPEVSKLTRRSAIGFAAIMAVFLPWCLAFMIGQEALFGEKLFDQLDASRIDMAKYGLVF